jgi:hypothetical protein
MTLQKALIVTLSEDDLRNLMQEAVAVGVAAALQKQRQEHPTVPLLTRTQLGKHLQVSPNQITKLIKQGMPSLGCGADRRFRLADVQAWMETQVR